MDVVLVDDDDLGVDALGAAGVVGDRVDALPGLLDDDLVGADLARGAQHRVGVDHAAILSKTICAWSRLRATMTYSPSMTGSVKAIARHERGREARLAGVARQADDRLAVLAPAAAVDAAEDRPHDVVALPGLEHERLAGEARGRGAG